MRLQPLSIEEAEDVLDAFFESWNAGDVEAVTATLGWADRSWLPRALLEAYNVDLVPICEPGSLIWNRTVLVSCELEFTDRFYTPAGIHRSASVQFSVRVGGLSSHTMWSTWLTPPIGDEYEFVRAFDDWLYERQQQGLDIPRGWIWIDPEHGLPNHGGGGPCWKYPVNFEWTARDALDYVEEFLAQPGDEWPLTTED